MHTEPFIAIGLYTVYTLSQLVYNTAPHAHSHINSAISRSNIFYHLCMQFTMYTHTLGIGGSLYMANADQGFQTITTLESLLKVWDS